MNRRGAITAVPEPMRASDTMIARCRETIDSPLKKSLRVILNTLLKRRNGIAEIGEGFQLGLSTRVSEGSRLGRYAYIGAGFSAQSPVCVGDLCMISTNVVLVGNDHGTDNAALPVRLDFRWVHKITVFEGDAWIGHGAIIRSGITIGRGAVVAARAVVKKDVEPYTIVGGNPARVIRKRFDDGTIREHDRLVYGDALGSS